jgi:sporulation protein YlmC with PRC-barrel domain
MNLAKPIILSFSLLAFAGASAYAQDPSKTESSTQVQPSTSQGAGTAGGARPEFSSLDKDNDGSLSKEEVAGHPELEANFDKLDSNNDQKLSRSEYEAGMATAGASQAGQESMAQREKEDTATLEKDKEERISQQDQPSMAQRDTGQTARSEAQTGQESVGAQRDAGQQPSATEGRAAAGATAQPPREERTAEPRRQDEPQQQAQDRAGQLLAQGEMSVDRLIGQKVTDRNGNDLGKIDEVVLDMQAGKVHAAVIQFGGFLGMGGKNYAFAMSELQRGQERDQLVVDVDKQKLEKAEGFAQGQWPAMDSDYWGRIGSEQQASAGGQEQASAGGQQQASAGASAPQEQKIDRKMNLVRASKILDEDVHDQRGEKIGRLRDLVIDEDGELKHAAIDVDDAGHAKVQADQLALGTDNRLLVNMDHEQLKGQAQQASDQPARQDERRGNEPPRPRSN